MKALRIALIGTRGIPARYGGFETFAEEWSTRLAEKGHSVTVYGRKHYVDPGLKTYRGVRQVVLPSLVHKYLDTLVHTFLCSIHVCFTRADVVYYCNVANACFTVLPRLFGKKVWLNVDGLEWKRAKWNAPAKRFFLFSEWLASRLPVSLVTDSRAMQEYYRTRYRAKSVFIPYGAAVRERVPSGETLARLGLEPGRYFLYVSRLEPENNALSFIEAYRNVRCDLPLVIVGDAPYSRGYLEKLKKAADGRVIFTGGIYGDGYLELLSHARIYLHGNEVGGTNPALLQAMALENSVIAIGVDFNRETGGETVYFFEPGDLRDLENTIRHVLDNPEEAGRRAAHAKRRIRELYDWERVVSMSLRELFNADSKKDSQA
jgi:glycosyltransferase involved in cell wall biosynthesis